MIERFKALLIFLVLFSSYGIACYSKQEVSYVFGGTVINSKKVIVPNARIVARIIEEDPNQAAKKFVTYTGARGKWQLKIPPAKTIKIKVFSNGYKALEKNIVIKEWLATKRKINFILFQDLEDICWGSLNYLQLYVNPLHQKNIEKYIQTGKMKKADRYLENVIKPIKRPYAYNFAGYIAFVHAKLEESKKYFTLGGSKLWFNLMGKSALKKKNYPQALLYYLQGVTEVNKARSLLLLAKKFDQLGDRENEKKCYQAGFTQYDTLLKSFRYKWDGEYINKRYFCRKVLEIKFGIKKSSTEEKELTILLQKAGEYCKKLSEMAIYYFCYEKKKDKIFIMKKLYKAETNPALFFARFRPIGIKGRYAEDYYKYDLQFIKQDNGLLKESRKILLEELDNNQFGAPVRSYSIKKPLHGPHTLVGFGWQKMFDYRILGREKIFNEDTLIIEAIPQRLSMLNNMSGKLWISRTDGSILKIEWYFHRVQNRKQLRIKGLILDMEPQLEFISEYNFKRKGIRYPSRFLIRETYIKDGNRVFVKLTAESKYEKYRFFNIDSIYEIE